MHSLGARLLQQAIQQGINKGLITTAQEMVIEALQEKFNLSIGNHIQKMKMSIQSQKALKCL